jgi:putative ABC transport system permease protein
MIRDYFRIATRSLRRRRLRSWLTMIGIFIGIAAVVGLISLGQGMQKAIEEQFFQLGADKVSVSAKGFNTGPPGSNNDVRLTTDDVDVVRRAQGVDIAAVRLVEPITVEFNDVIKYPYVVSMPEDPEERAMVTEIANVQDDDLLAGRNIDARDTWKALIGEPWTEPRFDGAGLSVGDKVKVNGITVDIVGIFKRTGNPIVDGVFVMNEEQVRDLIDDEDKVGVIAAKASPGYTTTQIAESITKDLRRSRGVDEGKEDFEVQTSEDLQETFGTVLGIVTAVLVGIAAVSLLVGGIGIMNTMYTSVLERNKEIGIMKAIGGRNEDILFIFLIESGMLGLVGGLIGVLLGMGLSKLVEVIATIALGTVLIQAYFPWYLILGALVFSFGIGALAGTYPAYQASKLQPVEALRQ